MFGPWDIVRPRRWHWDSAIESSLQDLEHMHKHMNQLGIAFSRDLFADNGFDNDDEFFKDLPMENKKGQAIKENEKQPQEDGRRGYSSYTYSSSSIMDNSGKPVKSVRRRYEDSTGRLKAVHEREFDGKKLKSTWRRKNKDDEGKHETICSSGTPEEFEKLWSSTAFGSANMKAIKDKKEG